MTGVILTQVKPLYKHCWAAIIEGNNKRQSVSNKFYTSLGVILQVNFNREMGDLSWRAQREDATYLLGLLAIGCATMTSGFAGVYNEKVIKNGQQPLLLIRSLQLSNIYA